VVDCFYVRSYFDLEQEQVEGRHSRRRAFLLHESSTATNMIKEEKIDKKACMCSVFSFVRFRNIGPDSPNPHMLTNPIDPGLIWLPSFEAGIKKIIYNSDNCLFGCHGIGYAIYLFRTLLFFTHA
jgi:hypothetical protein